MSEAFAGEVRGQLDRDRTFALERQAALGWLSSGAIAGYEPDGTGEGDRQL